MTCRRSHPSGVLVSHGNTRSTDHGRRLLIDRVRHQEWAVAHAAAATAISRQCAHRWVARFDAHGEVGLEDLLLTALNEHRRGQ
ncbi:MAG: leucine zipper domain-containing protein, partial [Mycobacteriaceae bacterium]